MIDLAFAANLAVLIAAFFAAAAFAIFLNRDVRPKSDQHPAPGE